MAPCISSHRCQLASTAAASGGAVLCMRHHSGSMLLAGVSMRVPPSTLQVPAACTR